MGRGGGKNEKMIVLTGYQFKFLDHPDLLPWNCMGVQSNLYVVHCYCSCNTINPDRFEVLSSKISRSS